MNEMLRAEHGEVGLRQRSVPGRADIDGRHSAPGERRSVWSAAGRDWMTDRAVQYFGSRWWYWHAVLSQPPHQLLTVHRQPLVHLRLLVEPTQQSVVLLRYFSANSDHALHQVVSKLVMGDRTREYNGVLRNVPLPSDVGY